ncbi:hypothetical protein [Anaeromyxobacter paludicola]|uniref:Uncharacterized protein n=1 Tax=Anaeromyxobacter paludicola TaxID=2918171 RepID=A0ABN6N336_9BACT|nr:hypothetical protein [Anaeromyxobacter paludicola]BDG07595.1 hypothetical protein AMPC_07080 [Anaeromyxobacter paludicola]
MDFVRHSVQWARGEILEMTLIAAAGLTVAVIGVAFGRLGSTPLAKAMLVPLVVLGLFFVAIGVSGYATNRTRIPAYEQAYREDPAAFVRAEQKRVEGFQYMYRITNVLAPICFAVAAGLFWLTLDARARAAGIALVVFGLFGFIVDGFSKERAGIYHSAILEALPGGPPAEPTHEAPGSRTQHRGGAR